jgi:diaminopimelate epimerase
MDGRRIAWRRLAAGEYALELGALAGVPLRAVAVDGRPGTAVDFWNPHAVFPAEELESFPLAAFAARCDLRADLFPAGVNVEIVHKIGPAALRLRVRERGVGETRACGSGAVAVALAAWAAGAPDALELRMPGGALRLERDAAGIVVLAGAASVTPLETTV